MNIRLTYSALALLASASLVYACSGTNPSDDDGNTTQSGNGGAGAGTSNGGNTTGVGGDTSTTTDAVITVDTGVGGQGGSCVDLVVEAEVTLKPADIIFVIDNSGSMSEEINSVEQNINTNFAQVMAASNVDYRIIMVTNHGTGSYDVCIGPPLSGTTNCSGPPVNIPNQFYHYSVDVQSHDSFCKVLNTFYGNEVDEYNMAPNGWSTWARPEALKVFVEMSDDGASCTWNGTNYNDGNNIATGQQAAIDWDKDLLALSPLHFGTQASRNYQFYSIVALAPKNPTMPLEPWNEFDPVTTNECTPGAVDPGTAYQWLSKGTGALRFPLCDPSGYNVVFQDIAAGVEEGTQVSCELGIPQPEPGQTLDLNTLTVVYTPMGNGTPQDLTQVMSLSQCGPNNFYIENDLIHICPQSCSAIEADNNALLEIRIECGEIAE
jgi:hypothetical protein